MSDRIEQRRAEMAMEAECLAAEEAFLAAKAAYFANPGPDTEPEYRAAKARFSELRVFWRSVAEATGIRVEGGGAVATAEIQED